MSATTFAAFHFLRPLWLLALLALPVLWYALRHGGGGDRSWRGAVDAHLLRHLLERDAGRRSSSPHWLLAAAWVVACLALSGPAWERLPQPLFENRAARVIALELAPSMRSRDVKPSRIERARFKIVDILRRSGDAQTALIAYAGDAHVVAPLTDDTNTVQNFVGVLEPSIMPVAGNDTGAAIELGVKLIKQAGLSGGQIVLVADSVSANAAADAARARREGVRVSVLGIGTTQGAPIATRNGGFMKDAAGNIMMPKLDPAALAAVAAAGGGRYSGFTGNGSDLDRILADLRPDAVAGTGPEAARTARFLDRGPWLLLLLVPLAGLGFRRGWLMLLPLAILLQPQRAQAMSWADLWSRPDQRAQAALDSGDAKRAQELARDPQLRGTAAYRAKDYAAAAQAFNRPADAQAQYNLGNALAKQAKYPDAIAAYDRALKLRPGMEDAVANRKAIEDWLKQHQKQNGKSGSNGNDKNGQRNSADDSASQQSSQQQQQRSDRDSGQGDSENRQAQNRQGSDQQGQPQDRQGRQSAGESQGDRNASAAKSNNDNDKADAGRVGDQPDSKAAEQRAQKQFRQSMDQALKSQAGKKQPKPIRLGAREDGNAHDEKEQAVEQWLQRVPDDPGGLLRRKFQLENQRRQQGGSDGGDEP